MRLRIEVTQVDIAKAKSRPWTAHRAIGCPVYHALVRTTGHRQLSVSQGELAISWGRMRMICPLPPAVTERIQAYDQGNGVSGQMEPFTFDLELNVQWAKLICLYAPHGVKLLGCSDPCVHCAAHPRESGGDQCAVCQMEMNVPGADFQEQETATGDVTTLVNA